MIDEGRAHQRQIERRFERMKSDGAKKQKLLFPMWPTAEWREAEAMPKSAELYKRNENAEGSNNGLSLCRCRRAA